MRLISFSLTERQLLDGSKTVTRRQVGSPRSVWHRLKPGDELRAVDKAMGLKPGQHPRELAVIKVVSVRMEKLDAIDAADCAREGFPEMAPAEFVDFFVRHMGCPRDQLVARIEFRVERMVERMVLDGYVFTRPNIDCAERLKPPWWHECQAGCVPISGLGGHLPLARTAWMQHAEYLRGDMRGTIFVDYRAVLSTGCDRAREVFWQWLTATQSPSGST